MAFQMMKPRWELTWPIAALLAAVLAGAAAPKGPAEVAVPAYLVDIDNPQVPHDVPKPQPQITRKDVAIFAWQEFVALNWPALDPAKKGVRGRADTTKKFSDADPGLPVWQTYRHKNELFPAGGKTDSSFDSKQPAYKYARFPRLTSAPGASRTLWNNLDESTQIGQCTLFANNSTSDEWRLLYEAKVNRAVFDYANQVGLTQGDPDKRQRKTTSDLGKYAGRCSPPEDGAKVVMLPCGDNSIPGDSGEGAIEVKAAWRKLTQDEINQGTFFMSNVIYYEDTGKVPPEYIVHNDTYGLVGLHIIHKTRTFPAFVFATWEHVDAHEQAAPSGLQLHNLILPNPGGPYSAVERAHAIPSDVQAVTGDVHAQLEGTKSVWKNYQLVGVQYQPMDGPPSVGAPADQLSEYFLANIFVETNQTLQSFYGTLGTDGKPAAKKNIYLYGQPSSPYQMGGCQGCHGAAGQLQGGDMSVLIANGGANTAKPEAYNFNDVKATKSASLRFAASH